MNRRFRIRLRKSALAGACACLLLLLSWPLRAGTWSGIEPLTSRRADVERVLGKPVENKPGETGTLRFKVAGGTVTVVFVDARFVAAHKLAPELVGTVRQIVLQHENAPDTPESLKLTDNKDFVRDTHSNAVVYRNQRDGVAYTFIEGRLRTTNFTASAEQVKRAQRGS